MTAGEKLELALIPVAGIAFWLLARSRRTQEVAPQRAVRCMCIESTVGATGIIAGAIVLGAGITHPVAVSALGWSVSVMLIMSIGFLIKDYVLEWSPWRIRRDRDHMNIVFTWKS